MMEDVKNTELKAEFDWKNVLRKPTMLFGYSYLYFLLFVIVTGYLYISNLTVVGKNSIKPYIITDSSAYVEDIPFQSARILPPVDVMKVGISSPELITKGKPLYSAHCASCHGENGKGDDPSSALMNPKPRNFIESTGWKNGNKVSEIYVTLEDGLVTTGMPSFNYLSPEDRFAIIHYIRSIANISTADKTDDLKMLDATYNLSSGLKIPGQIPVKKATEYFLNENKNLSERIERVLSYIKNSRGKNAQLFRKLVDDERKIITIFVNGIEEVEQYQNFKKSLIYNPLEIGFKPAILRISDAELAEIHKFLLINVK